MQFNNRKNAYNCILKFYKKMDILQIENVSKSFANHKALDDVSLTIPQGSIYGFLGPNGAGKTTLLRIINRITAPDSGRVLFDGHPITADDIYSIGYMPEERGLYKKMKVGEQAIFFARLKGLTHSEATKRLKEWFDKFQISDWWNRSVDELSKGMAQKVQFITTILHSPKLLIFDEPFSGFDPINANLLKSEIMELRDKGATIIFSTHNLSSVEEICDHITLINKSRNILSGNVKEIRHRHGANTFELDYRGDEATLLGAIGNRCEIMESNPSLTGYSSIKIHIADDAQVRNVISAANESVNLRSFRELIPSMNDIFIRAVNGTL